MSKKSQKRYPYPDNFRKNAIKGKFWKNIKESILNRL